VDRASDRADRRADEPVDQLTMRLDAALPNLPAGLRPMLARPLPEAFDSPVHLFEPMWGGARALALIGPSEVPGAGDVQLVAEDGTQGPAPVDLAGIAGRIAARSAVLDGEIVVVDEAGRLDHEELARRLGGQAGRSMSYLAFDLLHLDGRSLLNMPLDRRRTLLRQVLRPGDEVVAVPAVPTDGRALFDAVTAQGLRGIRARQRTSPYLPGVRSRLWRSVEVGAVGGSRLEQRIAAAQMAEATDITGSAGRSEPVLSLIRRLPLEFDDDAGPERPAG
jgi:bifunctional non-homologous end joining protein LigD